MNFRKKILISFFVVFFCFVVFIYPMMTELIVLIQKRNLYKLTVALINKVKSSPNEETLISNVKELNKVLFFRITLFDTSGRYLFDSYQSHEDFGEERKYTEKELAQTIKKGQKYEVHFSKIFGQNMAYMSLSFDFHGKKYIIRTGFPYGQITSLTHDFTLMFMILSSTILLLFCLFALFIIHVLTRPVQRIIEIIKPYQLGKIDKIPNIPLDHAVNPDDEFDKLAETLNSLSSRIDAHISSITNEKNEKSAILESLVEGVIAVDENMDIIYMNRMASIFLGVSEPDILGRNFSVVKNKRCQKLILDAQKSGHPVVLVIKPERKQKRFFDAVAIPRDVGGAILVLQDKTGLHKVIEMGRDFIANASHELKTPITIIRGFAETLNEHPELTREMYKEITAKIVSNCNRMYTLVKNLLTLASVDEGLPLSRLQECDLYDLSEQAKNTVLSIHHEANITVEAKGKEPCTLLLDSDLFFQAILNLLDNAVKYSKPPAKVAVTIEKQENDFVIRVSDEGMGIPEEDLDRIFERFYAVNKSHSRSLGGSGLGLSIVERIIEKHNGKIEVESKLGVGTTFIITLPIHIYPTNSKN